MATTPSESPLSIAATDVYSAAPVIPMYAPTPVLGNGARVYGASLDHTEFSFSKPAYVEDLVAVHLSGGLTAIVTCDRPHYVQAAPGDVFVLPCQGHFTAEIRVPERVESQLVALPPRLMEQIAYRDLDGEVRGSELRLFLAEHRDPLLYGIGWAIQLHLQSRDRDQLYIELLLTILAVHVLRNYSVATPRLRPHPSERDLPVAAVRRVRDYVEAHLDRSLTLTELGDIANYSPYHLARLFRSATGQTLHQYVTMRRLERARTLLETTDLPLHQVANLSGFHDQGQLSRLFHRVYGCTPSSQRRA